MLKKKFFVKISRALFKKTFDLIMSYGNWKTYHYKKRKKKVKIKKYADEPPETQNFQQHKLRVDNSVKTGRETITVLHCDIIGFCARWDQAALVLKFWTSPINSLPNIMIKVTLDPVKKRESKLK